MKKTVLTMHCLEWLKHAFTFLTMASLKREVLHKQTAQAVAPSSASVSAFIKLRLMAGRRAHRGLLSLAIVLAFALLYAGNQLSTARLDSSLNKVGVSTAPAISDASATPFIAAGCSSDCASGWLADLGAAQNLAASAAASVSAMFLIALVLMAAAPAMARGLHACRRGGVATVSGPPLGVGVLAALGPRLQTPFNKTMAAVKVAFVGLVFSSFNFSVFQTTHCKLLGVCSKPAWR